MHRDRNITRAKNGYPVTSVVSARVTQITVFPHLSGRNFARCSLRISPESSAKCTRVRSPSLPCRGRPFPILRWDSPRIFPKIPNDDAVSRKIRKCDERVAALSRGECRRWWRRRRRQQPPRERGWTGRRGGVPTHRATNGDRFRVWVRRGRSPPGAARETRNPGS